MTRNKVILQQKKPKQQRTPASKIRGISIYKWQTYQIKIPKISGVDNAKILFKSSDTSVAKVSRTGLVTPVSFGTALISMKYNNETSITKIIVKSPFVTINGKKYTDFKIGKHDYGEGAIVTGDHYAIFYETGHQIVIEIPREFNNTTTDLTDPDFKVPGNYAFSLFKRDEGNLNCVYSAWPERKTMTAKSGTLFLNDDASSGHLTSVCSLEAEDGTKISFYIDHDYLFYPMTFQIDRVTRLAIFGDNQTEEDVPIYNRIWLLKGSPYGPVFTSTWSLERNELDPIIRVSNKPDVVSFTENGIVVPVAESGTAGLKYYSSWNCFSFAVQIATNPGFITREAFHNAKSIAIYKESDYGIQIAVTDIPNYDFSKGTMKAINAGAGLMVINLPASSLDTVIRPDNKIDTKNNWYFSIIEKAASQEKLTRYFTDEQYTRFLGGDIRIYETVLGKIMININALGSDGNKLTLNYQGPYQAIDHPCVDIPYEDAVRRIRLTR